MKHRARFTADDLAAYDEGYQIGLRDEEVNLPPGATREEMAAQLIKLIGVVDGLQERVRREKRRE